jgi:DNA-binding SARP family transcriptional activator
VTDAASVPEASTTPVDGRLRGPDFAATVTQVAWPDRATYAGQSEEPPTGHRFIVFALHLAENSAVVNASSSDPAVTAAVEWGGTSHALSLNSIDDVLAQQPEGPNWPSASAVFQADVPNSTHAVNLVLSQGSFSQSFNLWSLRRNPPAPTVLYRDPNLPTLSDTAPASATIALSNPADGYSDSDQVTLQNTSLSYFAPPGVGTPPSSSNQAVLSVIMDSEYPQLDPSNPDWGHYLQASSPLPASLVTFTPTGGSPIAATMSDAGSTAGKGDNDDGLFDATYSFIVPASLTAGTVNVGSGAFSGTEYTGFQGVGSATPMDVTAPTSLAVSFPAPPMAATQEKPPWVGAPLPATTAAAAATSSGSSATPSPSGFPIWLAVLILVLLAVGVVLVQRHRRRGMKPAPAVQPASSVIIPEAPKPEDPTSAHGVASPEPIAAAALAPNSSGVGPVTSTAPRMGVLGPVEVWRWLHPPERRIIEELLCYLVLHNRRPMSADQIQRALRPLNGSHPEVSRKTFHTYLSTLRQCIGAEYLPDANASGYQVTGVESDWVDLEALAHEADRTIGREAIELRTQALALVRGVPFDSVADGQYQWDFNEQLASQMTATIATCAIRLANDLYDLGEYIGVEETVRIGLLAAPDEVYLWEVGARALEARNEGHMLRRHLADARRHVEAEDMERITPGERSHSASEEQ